MLKPLEKMHKLRKVDSSRAHMIKMANKTQNLKGLQR